MKKSLFKVAGQLSDKKGNSLNAKGFFDNYYSKTGFLELTGSLERKEPIHFVEIFEALQKGERIKFDPTLNVDKWGKSYMWIEFTYARATRGLKLVGDENMVKFISDYAHGKINVDFTVDELTDEAFTD
jgi:hypothetical protein